MLKMPQGPGDTLRNVAVASAIAIYRRHPEDPATEWDERERDRRAQEDLNAAPSVSSDSERSAWSNVVERLPFG